MIEKEETLELAQRKDIEKIIIRDLCQNGITYRPEVNQNGLLLPYPVYQSDTDSYRVVHFLIPKEVLKEAIK